MEQFHEAGLEVVTHIDASLDDWDRFESLHWFAAEKWLAKHADEPDTEEIRTLTDASAIDTVEPVTEEDFRCAA